MDCNDCKYKKKYVIKSVLNLIKKINNKFINQQLLYLQKKKVKQQLSSVYINQNAIYHFNGSP